MDRGRAWRTDKKRRRVKKAGHLPSFSLRDSLWSAAKQNGSNSSHGVRVLSEDTAKPRS